MAEQFPLRHQKGENGKFYFSLAYLCLSLLLKTVQIFLTQDYSLFFYLPYFVFFDLPVSVFVFLTLDLPLNLIRLKQNWYFRSLRYILYLLYFILAFYTVLMLKFFILFGGYLSYGMLMQAHHPESFKGGILKEADLFLAGLFLFSLIFLWMSVHYKKKLLSRKSLRFSFHKVILLTIPILVMAFSSFLAGKVKKNFYDLDQNPFIELIQSTLFKEETLSLTDIAQNEQTAEEKEPSSESLSAQNPKDKKTEKDQRQAGFEKGSLNSIQKQPKSFFPEKEAPSKNLEEEEPLTEESSLKGMSAKNMNVVLVILESTPFSYTDLLKPGKAEITPRLKEIATHAIVFPHHYTPEPATLKSLFALLTGNYPYQTDFRANWKGFVDEANRRETFLGEILSQAGYQTALFTTADPEQYFLGRMLEKSFRILETGKTLKELRENYPQFRFYSNGMDDRVLISRFENFLDQQRTGKFFTVLMPMFPHHPYEIPAAEFRIRKPENDFSRYQNSLFCADSVIGGFYQALKKRELLKQTLFVVVSDHGEAFFQHPRNYIHSLYLYEENVHALALISHPTLFPTLKVFQGLSRHMDLFSTLLALLNISAPGQVEGKDLRQGGVPSAGFYTTFSTPYAGIRQGFWKYLYNLRYQVEELYDLKTDPEEKINLADKHPELCRQFRKQALKLIEQTRNSSKEVTP